MKEIAKFPKGRTILFVTKYGENTLKIQHWDLYKRNKEKYKTLIFPGNTLKLVWKLQTHM